MGLMVPYYTLDKSAGLVQVWGKLGYPSIEWMVSIGKQQKECHCYIILLQARPAFGFGLWDQVHANIRQPRLNNSGPTVGAGHYSVQFFRQPHSLLLNRTN